MTPRKVLLIRPNSLQRDIDLNRHSYITVTIVERSVDHYNSFSNMLCSDDF